MKIANFLAKSEFHNKVKLAFAPDKEYKKSKFLDTTLKTRKLSDINDLHHFLGTCVCLKCLRVGLKQYTKYADTINETQFSKCFERLY